MDAILVHESGRVGQFLLTVDYLDLVKMVGKYLPK